MASKFIFASFVSILTVTSVAQAEWTGEWAAWSKVESKDKSLPSFSGAGLKIESNRKFLLRSLDEKAQGCSYSGKINVVSETEANASIAKTCELRLTLKKDEGDAVALEMKGAGCAKTCSASTAFKRIPTELALRTHTILAETLPWPQCQADLRTVAQLFCADQEVAKKAVAIGKLSTELGLARAQASFLPKDHPLVASEKDSGTGSAAWHQSLINECEGDSDPRGCAFKALEKTESELQAKTKELKALKAKHDAELTDVADAKTAKKNMEAIQGTYSRTFQSGSASGDKFEVTDDINVIATDEKEIEFDVLLNFFDEQLCELSGTAKALRSGKFFFKKGKCRLLIYKEGNDLVVTDDPAGSCKSFCGKKGTFTNGRFPFSSRKAEAKK